MDKYLIDGWRRFYKMYSIWFFILLGSIGDIYNVAIESGLLEAENVPAVFVRILNAIAFAGGVSRLLKQKKLEIDNTVKE